MLHRALAPSIFTARRYASAVYAVVVCPSIRPSVCLFFRLSQAGTVPKELNAGSRKQRHTIGSLVFWRQKSRRKSDAITPNCDAV